MTQKILITGGMGYLGGRIARYLAVSSDHFLRLSSRKGNSLDRPDWVQPGELVSLNVTSADECTEACSDVSTVIHLAALNEIESAKHPDKALVINGLGSLLLLRAAEKAGVRRFIYMSTAHVYGAPLVGEIDESSLPRPTHPYAITHKVAEDFILASHDRGNMECAVIRLSNGFGAPEHPDVERWTLLVNDLCKQAAVKGKLVLKSPGLQWRDFITLADTAQAVAHFIDLPVEGLGDGLFNLGGNCPMRIIDMAKRIVARCEVVLGFRPELRCPTYQGDDVAPSLHYKTDKIYRTGFKITGSIDAEIDATLRLCHDSFS